MAKQLLTVFGATGNQGGSVITTMLAHANLRSKWSLRGVTRDPSSAKSQALAARGVEVVRGDLEDVSTLAAAVAGSHAVFAVTDFWTHMDGAKEEAQGRAIADAAFAAGVRHLVWSSLPYADKVSAGKLPHVNHFDSKARVGEYIEAHKAASGTAATYIQLAFYMTNVKGSVRKGPDGKVAWSVPWDPKNAKLPLFNAAGDTGKYVAGILEAGPAAADGAKVHAVSEWSTPAAAAQVVADAAGVEVEARHLPRDVFKGFLPAKVAEELTENMELVNDYSYYGPGSELKQAEHDRFVLPGEKLTTWKEFVAANGPWEF